MKNDNTDVGFCFRPLRARSARHQNVVKLLEKDPSFRCEACLVLAPCTIRAEAYRIYQRCPKTTTIHNVLTRAGIHVTLAKSSLGNKDLSEPLVVPMARGMSLVANVLLDQIQSEHFDAVVIPGGVKGAENLRDDPLVIEKIRNQLDRGKLTGAICAAPAITLASHRLLDGRRATCYPGFEASLPNSSGDSVVVDGKLVTSQGPGTAIEFALTLVELLQGSEIRHKVADQILYSGSL